MKLRNKKTGEIVETDCAFGVSIPTDKFMGCKSYDQIAEYNSLAELNEEWEDYGPAEPLIRDEKIRKAVRAWAEAIKINRCKYDEFWKSFRFDNCTICFKGEYNFDGLEDEEIYTIAELCGEEEDET